MRPAKLTVAATSLVALVALTACGTAQSDDEPLVLTTFTVLADMTRTVAGDHVRVESITKPGAEVHGYEPTPGDLRHAPRQISSSTTDWVSNVGSSSSSPTPTPHT